MKKSTALVYHLGFILYFCSTLAAQDIQLQTGNKIKTIKAGTFVELTLSSTDQEPCVKCSQREVDGQLVSCVNGVVNLKVQEYREPLMDEKINSGFVIKHYEKQYGPVMSFETKNILSVTKKGKKKIKEFTPLQSVGMVLILMGGGHLISAPIANESDKNTAKTLLGVGATELVLGIILGTAFDQKSFITSEACPEFSPGEKLWVIN